MELCIADNLRILRQKRGYTLEALAEIISVSRQTVAKWESNDSYPDIVNCAKLAALYKITLDELVNKPLTSMLEQQQPAEDGKICGVTDVKENGAIVLPQSILDMFSLHPGEKVLLLADKNQGLAILKCGQF